ncbi:MAG: hypothetical protein ACLSFW_06945 [Bacteroides cellulosilyticus]
MSTRLSDAAKGNAEGEESVPDCQGTDCSWKWKQAELKKVPLRSQYSQLSMVLLTFQLITKGLIACIFRDKLPDFSGFYARWNDNIFFFT